MTFGILIGGRRRDFKSFMILFIHCCAFFVSWQRNCFINRIKSTLFEIWLKKSYKNLCVVKNLMRIYVAQSLRNVKNCNKKRQILKQHIHIHVNSFSRSAPLSRDFVNGLVWSDMKIIFLSYQTRASSRDIYCGEDEETIVNDVKAWHVLLTKFFEKRLLNERSNIESRNEHNEI